MTPNDAFGPSRSGRVVRTLLLGIDVTAIKCACLAIALVVPAGAHAQVTPPGAPASQPTTPTPAEPRRNAGKRVLDFVGDLEWMGIRPTTGTIISGGGPAAGLEFKANRIGPLPMALEVEGLVSIRKYQQLSIRAGSLLDRRTAIRLDPSDGTITSVIRLPDTVYRGRALYLEQRFRRLPSLSLYGSTPADEATRTDFGQKVSTTELVFQWQGSRTFGVSARAGYLLSDPFSGGNNSLENTESVFAPFVGSSLVSETRYLVGGLGMSVDRRDSRRRPTMGAVLNLAAWRYQSRTDEAASFSRLWFDARTYRMLWSKRHVLAARVLGSYTFLPTTGEFPFQLAHHMGGSKVMRSFPSYRFRGQYLTTGTLETQWRVWRKHELVLFMDVGRVDRPTVPLGGNRYFTSTGLGARIWLSERWVVRGDVATGRDGIRFVGTLGTPF
jgi:hypothetical protein